MTHKSTKEVEVWRRGGVENEVCGEITHLAVTQGGPMFVGAPILNTNQSTFPHVHTYGEKSEWKETTSSIQLGYTVSV